MEHHDVAVFIVSLSPIPVREGAVYKLPYAACGKNGLRLGSGKEGLAFLIRNVVKVFRGKAAGEYMKLRPAPLLPPRNEPG